MLNIPLLDSRQRGIDVYTVLMMHMNGADGSTTFLDSSAYAHAISVTTNPQIDTAQSVFGDASGLFNGSSGTATSASSADFDFGTSDFTIDFRIRLASNKNFNHFIDIGNVSSFIRLNSSGQIQTYANNNTVTVFAGSGSGLSTDTWYHLALVRNGNSWVWYKDGVSWVSTTNTTTFGTTGALRIGGQANATNVLNGWLDELRFSKGIARWIENFTPPARAYSG